MSRIILRRFLAFILVLRISVLAFAQDDDLTVYYYPNGQVSSKGMLDNGKPVGFWTAYYVNGNIKSEGLRKNGLLDSVWVFYNRNGLIQEKINYLSGKKNGYYYNYDYTYNDDSVSHKFLLSEELYVDNIKNGFSNYYWESGNIKLVIFYENGVKYGSAKEYNENGNLIGIIEYRKGKEVDHERINRFKDGLKNGVWKDFYPNGKLKNEYNYWEGSLTGLVRSYDINGDLIGAQRFENDVLIDSLVDVSNNIDIKEEFYDILDEDGEPLKKSSGGYVDGIPIGVHRTYDSLGRVNSSKLYNAGGILIGEGIVNQEGDKVGIWKYYYFDSQLKSTGRYHKNRRVGKWQYFYKTGELEQAGLFKSGRPNDEWRWFYENGNIKREEVYFKGKENGSSIEYDEAGNIIASGFYDMGLKVGEWYYDYAVHSEKGKYINNNKHGSWYYFFKNGNLYFEGDFNLGLEDGKHIYYYKNGKIKEKRYYLSGSKIKNWEYYDYYGSLIKVLTFENNKLTKIDGISVLTE